MSDIKIENISDLSGLELFADSEGFLAELDDNDINNVIGGMNTDVTTAETCCATSCTCPAAQY